MVKITDILSRAARECSVDEPDSWLTSTDDDHVALRDDFMMETVEDILDRFDLPAPVGTTRSFDGDDVEANGYPLGSLFRRLQRDRLAVYETSPQQRACIPVETEGEWVYLQDQGYSGVNRYYRLFPNVLGVHIQFYPDLDAGGEVTVSYITSQWIKRSVTEAASAFENEDDELHPLLNRRAIETGIVWRFRRRNGLQYQDKYLEHEAILNRMDNDTNTRRTIRFDGGQSTRHPWDVPVPDYIPEA